VAIRKLALAPIRFYRLAISPLMASRCRFYPTCSAYALEAIERHGIARGGWLTVCRLGRCHPLHAGGYDPVPGEKQSQPSSMAK
jgi:hypothetical protein